MYVSPGNSSGPMRRESLDVYLLGLVDFESCVVLQEIILQEISARNDRHGVLLVCEHLPLLTIGREGSHSHVTCDRLELTSRRIDTRWINRGGGCLIHAPGQIAFYPILPLNRIGIGLDQYRGILEETVLRVAAELRIAAERAVGTPGVTGRTGQFAHIGTAVKSWTSYHGMFINVQPRLDWIRLVQSNPAGLRASSLEVEKMQRIEMHAVRESLFRHFASLAGYQQYYPYTGHPLLRRARRKFVHAGNC